MVVFRADRDEKDSRVAYWLGAIRCHAPNAPVIIVATHLDKYVDPKLGAKKVRPSMVEEALNPAIMEKYRSKYPKLERTIRAVSAMTYKGMDELIRHIHDVAVKQPYAQGPPPEHWLLLEQRFLDHRRRLQSDNVVPMLSWEDASGVSKISQFPSNDKGAELTKAVDYMHETGTIFRHVYTDDETGLSKRTIILDPQWAARVFSTVITTKHGYLRTGVLEEQKLYDQLWREYPKATHNVLMELFQQFDLCYRILDDKGQQTGEVMIPATLPTTKPSDVQSLLPGKETSVYQFERRYAFEFMPAGLFSRYLVRVMNEADPLRYWRYGCLVQEKGTQTFALIEFKPQSNLLSIVVRSGSDASQLFCKLTELFEFILHHSFKEAIYTAQYMDPITNTVFTLEQIEEASVKGGSSVTSKDGSAIVSIDRVAPDLALTTFAALQVDIEKEVNLLPTPLGEGAFAMVYEGVYKGEKVAVKRLLRCSTEEQQKRIFSEFRREVLTMSQVAHPNIVNLRAFSSQPPFSMIMELVPHGTLYDFLRKKDPIPWPMRIRIAYDIASAMNFLHSADPPLIHKDLKSPNILMAGTKYDDLVVAKVADFGISGKLYANKFKAISAKEREVENPTWLAPEIVKTKPYTAAADVYPYGIMLWELAARTHPFDEFHCAFPTDLEAVITSGKRPTIPSDTPRAFEALIEDCWHDNPSRRPTFAQILARFPTIIAEAAPALPSLLARIRRDLAEFNSQQEILKKARDEERREKWLKMREEESARAAERKRQQALSMTSSSTLASEDDISTDTEESMEASSEGANSSRSNNLASSEDNNSGSAMKNSPISTGLMSSEKSRDDISGSGTLRRGTQNSSSRLGIAFDMGGVYHRLTEVELKDLWIQRGIPLPQEGSVTKERLAEVLENDDQWLFNQRRVLFASSSAYASSSSTSKTGTPGTMRATLRGTKQTVPHAVSLPCLYLISPSLLPNEIQERNELIEKQEKALGELLRQQESARLELHSKHQRAIESRAAKASGNSGSESHPSPATTAAKDTSYTSGRSGSVSALRNAFIPPTNDSSSSAASAKLPGKSSSPPPAQLTHSGSSSTLPRTGPAPSRPDATNSTTNSTTASAASTPSTTPVSSARATLNASPSTSPSPTVLKRVLSTSNGSTTAATTKEEDSSKNGSKDAKNTIVSPTPTQPAAAKKDTPVPATTQKPATPSTTTASPGPAATTSTAPATQTNNSASTSSAPAPSQASVKPNAAGEYIVKGTWSVESRTAGGSPNTPQWRRNPQYTLTVAPGGGTVKILLTQKVKDPLPFIAFYIFKSSDTKRVLDIKEKIYAPEHFVNKESIEAVCNFPEGTFSIMCATFQPENSDYTLTVSGAGASSLAPVSEHFMAESKSEWLKPLAGGCMNHPTWRSNPKFAFKVTDATAKTKIYGVLIAKTEVGSGFYVFGPNQNVPIAKSGFTTVSVGYEFSVGPGDYTLLPATYEFGKESPFEVTLYSDKPVELTNL